MRMLSSLLATASFVAVFSTPLLAAEEAVLLPVRSVVLYKNGMGYFEHLGKVPDGQAVEISLPAAQLDDVLKSLTVLDLGRGGSIGGVTYESTAPLERRLAELPIDLGSVNGLTAFLNKIRGAEVELRAPSGAVAGRLMGAEVRSRTVERTSIEVVEAMVLTGAGEVRIVPMESVSALRLLDAALARDLARYLDLVSGSRRSDVRRLRIRAGVGERQLHLSYTSEAPIWKSTYRIVLDSKQKPLLQGWAIVDNTTPLDWSDVTVALVAGAPVSFVQRLSQPVYARRPVVPLPAGVQVTPQVHEGMIDDAEKKQEAGRLSYAAPPPPATAMAPAAPEESSAQMLRANVGGMMRATAPETAVGQALAEQFEYRFPEKITIRKNESALLPILQTELEAQKVSVYSAASGERRARLAVWLKNTSGLTLDGGAFTVIDENAFAGEGLAETIQPGESRLLSYALDLAVAVSSQLGSEQSSVQQIDINRGVLRMHSKLIERRSYVVRNNDARARTDPDGVEPRRDESAGGEVADAVPLQGGRRAEEHHGTGRPRGEPPGDDVRALGRDPGAGVALAARASDQRGSRARARRHHGQEVGSERSRHAHRGVRAGAGGDLQGSGTGPWKPAAARVKSRRGQPAAALHPPARGRGNPPRDDPCRA
ncbi:MAG: hypothetical protein DMD81_03645 [Candidatus Rokuibacteriota bacterium]|nr:MAG: hypothetical protein DMD81_03645 [Candidatus Rokubacteria bacterium]